MISIGQSAIGGATDSRIHIVPSEPASVPSDNGYLGVDLDAHREFWHTSAPYDPHQSLEPAECRYQRGKLLRKRVPRESHADWSPALDRPDPVETLLATNEGRQADLVPLRMARMAESPFAFLRGAAAVMAWDLARTPTTGLQTLIDGDAHINNFGLYATPQLDVVVDLNDFDEATLGPWEWDLKRLVASVNVAGRDNGLNRRQRAAAVVECVSGYNLNVQRLMSHGALPTWSLFAYADLDRNKAVRKQHSIRVGKSTRAIVQEVLDKAKRTTNESLLSKAAQRQASGSWRFVEELPIQTRLDDENRKKVIASLVEYAENLPPEYRFMLRRYSVVDVAHRVVGVGSVGLRAYLVLLFGNGERDP